MSYIIWILIGYGSGSILYAYLIPEYFLHIDICALSDDGNPGAANAFQYAGIPTGICVILCELLKAFLPVFFAARQIDTDSLFFAFVIAAPVAGHAYSIFCKGKGGKAIAASFGAVLALFPDLGPFTALAVFYIIFSTVIVITPHLYRSIITFVLFGITVYCIDRNPAVRLGCIFVGCIAVWKHVKAYHGEAFRIRFPLHEKLSG